MQVASPHTVEARINRSTEWTAGASVNPEFVTPQLQLILGVWEARRGSQTMPSRCSLTLRDLKFALPQLSILDVIVAGPMTRFKVRLMGSELDQILAPMTGCFIDEAVPAPFAERWISLLSSALQNRAPTRALSRAEYRNKTLHLVEALIAPLADDGKTPNKLLVACFYHLVQGPDGKPSDVVERLVRELG